MKISARLRSSKREVLIIAFVPAHSHEVKAVYIDDRFGNIGSCYIEDLVITDYDYLTLMGELL